MDDENMTYDVSEENGSIICRRLYVLMRLSFFYSDYISRFLDIHKRFVFIQMEFVLVISYVA